MRDNHKIVNLSFLVIALLTWFVISSLTTTGMGYLQFRDRPLAGPFKPSTLIGLGSGVLVALIFFLNEKVKTWCLDVVAELRKVVWPTLAETRLSTLVVIVMVIICTIILGIFDWIWSSATGLIYN